MSEPPQNSNGPNSKNGAPSPRQSSTSGVSNKGARRPAALDDLDALDSQATEETSTKLRDLFNRESMLGFRKLGGLLKYVKPYRVKLITVFLLSLVCSALVIAQLFILEEGLKSILGSDERLGQFTEDEKEGGNAARRVVTAITDLFVDEEELEVLPQIEREARLREHQRIRLGCIAFLLIMVMLLEAGCRYIQGVRMVTVIQRVILDLRMDVFVHLMAQPVRFYQKNHSAKLATRTILDLNRLGTFLTTVLIDWVRELSTFIGLIAFVVTKNGSFLFVIILFVMAASIPIRRVGRKLRKGGVEGAQGMGEVFSVLQEAVTGNREVKAFGSEEREVERFRESNNSYRKMMMHIGRLRNTTEPLVGVIGAIGLASLMWFGGTRVIDGALSLDSFFVLIMALSRAVQSMRRIGRMSNTFQMGLAAADRVTGILGVRPSIQDRENATELEHFKRRIIFRNVHYHYDRDVPVLKGINLTIEKGSILALVGPSGAGKSTFVDLIPRFYEVRKGAIIFDGKDIRSFTLKSLRKHIGIVSQETILFSHTVRENISYGKPDATMEEVVEAAKAAHAHDFITALPDGYETMVGERGVRFSGGERQRLAIARALLKDPPIMILDEATSALDAASEALVQAALARLMKDRTVIVIAHRLATIRRADCIAVMVGGQIVEQGSHENLLEQKGVYSRLHELQTSTDDWDELIERFDFDALTSPEPSP